MTNSGAISDTFDFSAWGAAHYTNGSDQDVDAFFGSQWGGRELAGGLAAEWMGHRLYNSATGRFESRDPIGYAGGNNLYVYCGDNPVNYSDPWGTDSFIDWYLNGEGGLGDIIDTYLFNGSVSNLGTVTGEYDGGCVGASQVVKAAAGVGVNVALLFLPGGEEGKAGEALAEGVGQLAKAGFEDGSKSFLGGLSKDVTRLPDTEFHHMPANSASPLSFGSGPGILMDTADHRLTASWGRGTAEDAYRAVQQSLIQGGRFDDAVQMDIEDIQSKFGSKYDDAILQMIDSL